MKHAISNAVQKELESLDHEKRDRVLRYIYREEEVGRFPSEKELLDIISYLKSKSFKESKKHEVESSTAETYALNFERVPKDYLKLFNCFYCLYFEFNICNNSQSILYQNKTNEHVVCSLFTEKNNSLK